MVTHPLHRFAVHSLLSPRRASAAPQDAALAEVRPDLPGCFSEGTTKDEARSNAREALGLYLEEARDPTWAVPVPRTRKGKQYEWVVAPEDVAVPLMIRQARQRHGLSQRQLAKRVGMTVQQLQKLESPGRSNPTVRTLAAISRALDEQLTIQLVA